MSRYGAYSEHAFIADYYDYRPVVTGRADFDFYLGYARQARGPVLELGCGTGRVLIPLAVAGARVAELFGNFDRSPLEDDSPEMVFVAEKA